MNRKRKNGGFVIVLVLTLVLAGLAVLCLATGKAMDDKRAEQVAKQVSGAADRIARENASIEAENAAATAAYNKKVAEYKAQLAQDEGENKDWPKPATGAGLEIVDLTGYEIELPQNVSISRQDMLYNGLLVVNQWHARPEDYDNNKPAYVHRVNKEIPLADHNQRLLDSAITAWGNLLGDAKVQHQWDYIILDSCYRDYEAQKKLYDEAAEKLKEKYSDPDELRAAVIKGNTSYPGTSEYNSGLSAAARLYKKDVVTAKGTEFYAREEGQWLLEHCWEYGFVFRFPLSDFPVRGTEDKSHITGITSRQNLFRYVGVANAAAMHALGDLCLEEYIEYLAAHPHIAVYEDGKLRYEIWREPVQNAATVMVTHTAKVDESKQESMLDNITYVDDDNIEWAFVVTVVTY
ncbi:MAG: D-alanyl-D-alanine carboxypeptidase family protein [Clostridia bacterium]|nr:D-alanyl-D-alanine carboxypeptidase family protein [Clostridia bacterium]